MVRRKEKRKEEGKGKKNMRKIHEFNASTEENGKNGVKRVALGR